MSDVKATTTASWPGRALLMAAALVVAFGAAPPAAWSHPLGNFSINHYSGIRIEDGGVELHYVLDLAEIPTFQELQETGVVADAGHASARAYAARQAETLREGLRADVDGRGLVWQAGAIDVSFPAGAGGLPTLRLDVRYRAPLSGVSGTATLSYRNGNYAGRAGWKEIVAVPGPDIALVESTVPVVSRSRQLEDYPTDLLNNPPQDGEARVVFATEVPRIATASPGQPPLRSLATAVPVENKRVVAEVVGPRPGDEPALSPASPGSADGDLARATPALTRKASSRDRFTELMTATSLQPGLMLLALVIAAGLGAVHALEPGHGKTMVAAYLVGSRGTARHALLLGLIVTLSHTAGVYALGLVTLYASRHFVPERIYPWLGALSGATIAAVGISLLVRRYAGGTWAGHEHGHGHHHGHHDSRGHFDGHDHRHDEGHDHGHGHHHDHEHDHDHEHHRDHGHHHVLGHSHAHDDDQHQPHVHGPARAHAADVSAKHLLALGVTGGIVPCPGALVVLLSAIALGRVGFGLALIVAFSAGLAAVLIAIGLLVVWAGRAMTRVRAEGAFITRWLPLTSAAAITVIGVTIAVQALRLA